MTRNTICKQVSSLVLGAFAMTLISSCGNKSSGTSKSTSRDPIRQELGLEGRYTVEFRPLNSSVSGITQAEGKIQVIADQIAVGMTVKDSPASAQHAQFIYESKECPSEIHDTNSDGFIDALEASKVLGKVLIPLDADLNSQLDGINEFPVSNFMGNYSYYKEGVLSLVVADLQSPDLNPKDEIMKLNSSEELSLEGRVIVVQGIANDIYLPGSIRTLDGVSDRASLAIACGKIVRTMISDSETTEETDFIY